VLGLAFIALNIWQTNTNSVREQRSQAEHAQEQLRNEGNLKYMQGQLDSMNRTLASVLQNSTPDKTVAIVRSIVAANSPPKPPTPTKTEYGALTNTELQNAAIKLANDLRELEGQERAEQYQTGNARMDAIRQASTEDEKSKVWNQYNNLDSQRDLTYQTRFRQQFQGSAQAMVDELLRRLPEQSRIKPQYPLPALEYGALAGAEPMGEVASYIEKLARTLPVK
jgi:hypothetical protein